MTRAQSVASASESITDQRGAFTELNVVAHDLKESVFDGFMFSRVVCYGFYQK